MPLPPAYPFVPKSNAHLAPGQFWSLRLRNGKFACGIVLSIPPKGTRSTKLFYGGLLDWVGEHPPTADDLNATPISLLDSGEMHIKAIIEYGGAIDGQIDLLQNDLFIPLQVDSGCYSIYSKVVMGYEVIRKASSEDHGKLSTFATWGYAVLEDRANKLMS